ncbi:MAG: hypothetical protein EA355_12895 [Rhodobacteraceae bacterium]|nr:MAG: hypothetical protein EA355_12895 [Paracoccaceae bacterium]
MAAILVPFGTLLALAGVVGSLVLGRRIRPLRADPDDAARERLKRLTFLNGAALGATLLGIAFIVIGRLFG